MRKSDFKKPRVNEGLADLADIAERDHEVQMARAELYKIAKHAIKLHEMLKGVSEETGLEGWVQSKITKAADYVDSVYHHLDYETKFEEQQVKAIESAAYKDALANRLYEKAESKSQQRLMGMALAYKRGESKTASPAVKELASSMSEKELEKFAKTKHEGLPDKVEEGWFSDSPEEIAQKSPQMKKLLALRDKHKKCYDNYRQIEKRIEILADRWAMDQGDVMGDGGHPKAVDEPDEFRRNNPNFELD